MVRLLWSVLDQLAILVHLQLLQCLALIVTHVARESDFQPDVDGIVVVVLVNKKTNKLKLSVVDSSNFQPFFMNF